MKLRISSHDRKFVIAFALLMVIISSGAALYVLNPVPDERYFAMWIVGPNGFAQHYYPHDYSNITVDEPVNWTIGVQNQMGDLEYVVVRVKLLNSTLAGPADSTAAPSTVQPILQFTQVLVANETWTFPFEWMLLNATRLNESISILGLSINGAAMNGQFASAHSGMNFRFVFELWRYDALSDNLTFSEPTSIGPRTAWTEIWFNATAES